jgi:hypothetical protein
MHDVFNIDFLEIIYIIIFEVQNVNHFLEIFHICYFPSKQKKLIT